MNPPVFDMDPKPLEEFDPKALDVEPKPDLLAGFCPKGVGPDELIPKALDAESEPNVLAGF